MTPNPTAKLIPLMAKLGTYFKQGVDHYATLKAAGAEATPEVISLFIYAKMEDWDPRIGGTSVLDPETKEAASRLLAGIVANLSKSE
jgi:hypothetical protein